MSDSVREEQYKRRITLLARSLFSICLFMLGSGILVFPLVLLHQDDVPIFWRWSISWLTVIVVYILVLTGLVFLCRWLLLYANSLQTSIAQWLRSPYDSFIWAIIFVISILTANYLIYILGSNFNNAIKALAGLVIFWHMLLWILLTGLYWPRIEQILRTAQPWFVGIGVAVMMILLLEGYLRAYDRIFDNTDNSSNSTGTKQYTRILSTVELPWHSAYWAEFDASNNSQWTPYLYWRRRPFSGEFINIDVQGIRYTLPPPGPADMNVFFMGGSTAWGTGARDEHTIPSELVTLLAEKGVNAQIINFGESGYVSRQDAILFQFQLQQGNIPDTAIFYWGANDISSAFGQEYIGLAANERNRVAEFEFGRKATWKLPANAAYISLLYDTKIGSFLLPRLGISNILIDKATADTTVLGNLEDANLWLTTYPGQGAEDITNYLISQMDYVEHLADFYGVEVIFVWQPAPYFKDPLCNYEQEYLNTFQEKHHSFDSFYRDIDTGFKFGLQNSDDNLLILSDLFAGHEECIFIDQIHITEAGNRAVAEQIARFVLGDRDLGQEKLSPKGTQNLEQKALLKRQIEEPAKQALGWLRQGWTYYDRGDYEQAASTFDKVITLETSIKPTSLAQAYLGLGRTYCRLGQTEKCLESQKQAMNLDSTGWEMLTGREQEHLAQFLTTEARRDLLMDFSGSVIKGETVYLVTNRGQRAKSKGDLQLTESPWADSPSLMIDEATRLTAPLEGISLDQGSLSVWARLTDEGTEYAFLVRVNWENDINLSYHYESHRWIIRYNGVVLGKVEFPMLPDDGWRHYVFTWQDGRQTFYIDGKSVLTGQVTASSRPVETFNIGWAGNSSIYHWAGSLAGFTTFNRALTPGEVVALYQTGIYNRSK